MSPEPLIRILIVEPDPAVATVHGDHVKKTAGFTVGGVAHSGAEALKELEGAPYDLLLLDLQLPDISGLELIRTLQVRNAGVDIIVVTAARQLSLVRAATSLGAIHYLLKPLTLRMLQSHLRRYATYRRRTAAATGPLNQHDIDATLALLRPGPRTGPVPGQAPSTRTLDTVAALLRDAPEPVTANEVAAKLGISRVTARRYLEELTAQRLADQTQRYGNSGRPRHLYSWQAE